MQQLNHTNENSVAAPKVTPSVLSKKRFQDIRSAARDFINDENQVEKLMQRIANIMKFDPDASMYTPEKGRYMLQKRKEKAAMLGVSVYEACGGKAFYQNHREERNQQRLDIYHKNKTI